MSPWISMGKFASDWWKWHQFHLCSLYITVLELSRRKYHRLDILNMLLSNFCILLSVGSVKHHPWKFPSFKNASRWNSNRWVRTKHQSCCKKCFLFLFFFFFFLVLIFFNYCHIESPAEENCSASPLFVSSLMSFNLTFICQSVPFLILTTR